MLGTGIISKLGLAPRVERLKRLFRPDPSEIAIFHITHHKAGSQWINRILHSLIFPRLILPKFENVPTHERPIDGTQYLRRPVEPGNIYPTLYITREQFDSVPLPRHWRRFVVVRDLRDTLISGYFSCKISHTIKSEWMQRCRDELNRLSVEDGLLYMLDMWLPPEAQIQWSWFAAGEKLIKYEELLKDDERMLEEILLQHCRMPIDPVRFREIIREHRFEAQTGGRRPGQEDRNSHERKGIAGDWRNHFTGKVAKAFRSRYGSLLVATGYEKNENW